MEMLDNTILQNLRNKDYKLKARRYRTNQLESSWADPIGFYDHFVSKNYEYLVYPDYNFCRFEPILLQSGFSTIKKSTLCISFRNNEGSCFYNKQHNISIATLFYDNTLTELNFFYNHYTNIGVDKFFMYYNGNLESVINTLPKLDNVEYIEWNHPYYTVDEQNKVNRAECQLAMLNTYMRKYGLYSKYNILLDVDEIILCPNLKLRLENEKNHLYLTHHFSCIDFEKNIIFCEKTPTRLDRGKMILNADLILPNTFIEIHHFWPQPLPCDIKMAHNRLHKIDDERDFDLIEYLQVMSKT